VKNTQQLDGYVCNALTGLKNMLCRPTRRCMQVSTRPCKCWLSTAENTFLNWKRL